MRRLGVCHSAYNATLPNIIGNSVAALLTRLIRPEEGDLSRQAAIGYRDPCGDSRQSARSRAGHDKLKEISMVNAIPRHFGCWIATATALLATFAPCPLLRGQDPKPNAPDDPGGRLAEMGLVFERIRPRRDQAEALTPAEKSLGPPPRWNDPTRRFSDGTLWAWGTKGRPLALVTVELYPTGPVGSYWSCELVSLTPGPLAAEFDGRFLPFGAMDQPAPRTTASWSPGASGMSWRPVPGAPVPAPDEAARLRQVRELAQRFTAHEVNLRKGQEQRYELRLLPRPVHRYTDPEADVLDGAMFLFASGTNPELALMLESRGRGTSATWSYGLARLSRAAPFVRYDGQDVWSQPYALRPVPTDAYYIVSIGRDDLR